MSGPLLSRRLVAAAAVSSAALWGMAAPKLVYHGWDTLSATPEEVLENASSFAAAGCDGLSICLKYTSPGGTAVDSTAFICGPALTWSDVEMKAPVLKKIVACEGLGASLLHVWGAPAKRLALADDAAWARAAANFGVLARLAKEGGLQGLLMDFEDYRASKQFTWFPEQDGGDYAAAVKTMRARGAEFFGAAFAAFPEMELVSFQMFANDGEYGVKERSPLRLMRKKRDLWPAFLNGMLDVMPATVRFTDGDENAYHYEAAKHSYDRAASRQFTGVLPLVASKNRAKYRAQMRVGFGFYLDGYVVDEKSPWHQPPVRGSRTVALDDNLRDAARACDGWIWLYGEKNAIIPWKTKTWTVLTRDWVGKPTWEDALPGFSDVLIGVSRPADLVKRRLSELKRAGKFANLAEGKTVGENGNYGVFIPIRSPDDSYFGVTFTAARGVQPSVMVAWQAPNSWLWGNEAYADYATDSDGRTRGYALARKPDGASTMYVSVSKTDSLDPASDIRNVEVFEVRKKDAHGSVESGLAIVVSKKGEKK